MADQDTGALSGGSNANRSRAAYLDGEYYSFFDDPKPTNVDVAASGGVFTGIQAEGDAANMTTAVRLRGANIYFRGKVFCPNGQVSAVKGIQVGDSVNGTYGIDVDALLMNLSGGAFDVVNDLGRQSIKGTVEGPTPTWAGVPHANSRADVFNFGANDSHQRVGRQFGEIGFYAKTPIARQTGVAVDAASIHAALVALGLITA